MTPSPKGLSVPDAVALIVGIVLGAGIFKAPSLVAASSGTEWVFLLLWAVGGLISLVGSLCYAELGSTYPNAGGDYHYLCRAYGNAPGFLFAWARMTVIQTGSIAMLAFIIGDYASEVVNLGDHSASWYAAAVIFLLTLVNIAGINQGKRLQRVLMAAYFLGLATLLAAGLTMSAPPSPEAAAAPASVPDASGVGNALIFVLLTYGGWNEAAYLSAEIRDSRRNMSRALLCSIGLITAVYLLMNYVFLKGLGLSGVSSSQAVAADLMRRAAGGPGATLISILIVVACLSTVNAMMITGARTSYALGRDFRMFGLLGRWREGTETPVHAMIAQGAISLLLVFLGTGTRSGFVMMVEYTAPVFWFFFLLVGISVMILRIREPLSFRPFRVPFYPWTPMLFSAVCVFMFQSSLAYTGKGALLGLAVLLAGLPFLIVSGFMGPPPSRIEMNRSPGTNPFPERKRFMKTRLRIPLMLVLMLAAAPGSTACNNSAISIPSTFGWAAPASIQAQSSFDVPYIPTPKGVVDKMLEMAKVGANDTVYDLGCGDGRLVITAAKEKGARGVGVDIDPVRIKESTANAARAKVTDRVSFVRQDLFETDISEATVLTMYLLPKVNLMLRPKIFSQLKPGSRVVSHDFDMDEWEPDAMAKIGSSYIYSWVVPANASGTWDLTVSSAEGQSRYSLVIDQEFQRIEGIAMFGSSQVVLKDAKVKGEALEFRIDRKVDGKVVPMKFEGRIEGDSIQGTMRQFGKGKNVQAVQWSARRDPSTAQPIDGSPKERLFAGLSV